jgi:hypothetical protein
MGQQHPLLLEVLVSHLIKAQDQGFDIIWRSSEVTEQSGVIAILRDDCNCGASEHRAWANQARSGDADYQKNSKRFHTVYRYCFRIAYLRSTAAFPSQALCQA